MYNFEIIHTNLHISDYHPGCNFSIGVCTPFTNFVTVFVSVVHIVKLQFACKVNHSMAFGLEEIQRSDLSFRDASEIPGLQVPNIHCHESFII